MSRYSDLVHATPAELRAAIRNNDWTGPTPGLARGYAQTNLVILPANLADDFAAFCQRNSRACPLVARTLIGDAEPREVAPGADLRSDVPRYRVFRHGLPDIEEPTDVRDLWRDDFVGFLLGCSFTFEGALLDAGLRVRHLDEGRNVPMYRTSWRCQPAGPFAGSLVVSMRPFPVSQVAQVIHITSQFPTMHGAPVQVGDPGKLGIADLDCPDFGDSVTVLAHEVPLFWACGVTPQLALISARAPLAITHSPGCMFVTDRTDESFRAG